MKEFTNRTQKRKRIELKSDDGPESKQKQSKLDSFSQGGFVSQVYKHLKILTVIRNLSSLEIFNRIN